MFGFFFSAGALLVVVGALGASMARRKSKEAWKTYKNVFDEYTLRNLFKLQAQGHFEELESPIAIGKESNVFTARTASGERVIVKIYRLETCDFLKMFQYLRSDPRFEGLRNQRRKTIFAWTKREFRNLMRAREVVRVPAPLVFRDNILVLELIGGSEPAPRVKDARPLDPEGFFVEVAKMMGALWRAGLVHGDLSEFNILNDAEVPVFIDFSQSTVVQDSLAPELLERDCRNVARFFAKLGVAVTVDSLREQVLASR
ncbi:serine protein kinase RIO [Candidatus Woesearchaeota archaeon]|nr:MAG: serine protein kinase RIO [Candidatus Woesearchaeota archaeon]